MIFSTRTPELSPATLQVLHEGYRQVTEAAATAGERAERRQLFAAARRLDFGSQG